MTEHNKCYGAMFHEGQHGSGKKAMNGKVFGFEIQRAGLAAQSVAIKADLKEWDRCRACPEFAHCYQFSMGKLALESAATQGI